MRLNRLKSDFGSISKSKRIGRGQGSGKGGTSTRGHNGAQSRSGYKRKFGFEGGQRPLQQRIPRRGFKPLNKVIYKPINLHLLKELAEKYATTRIDTLFLQQHGLIKKCEKYKILGKSALDIKLDVFAHNFSVSSMEQIVKAGGTTTILDKYA